jgi:VIT1/CCC1 family predicted Fe2+/Mn2+ transporter
MLRKTVGAASADALSPRRNGRGAVVTKTKKRRFERVLDPVDRVSEVMFGLLMALTFTGSISVASAGREEIRTMMAAALGCNLAWGLADAVMYLVRTAVERTRNARLLERLRGQPDAARAHALLAAALSGQLGAASDATLLESLRQRLLALPADARPLLGQRDFIAAFSVFLWVVAATFPVVLPFALFDAVAPALRTSQLIALAMLFGGGAALGRYADIARPWRAGLALMVVGVLLVGAIKALGG